jgi:hypothetical protein
MLDLLFPHRLFALVQDFRCAVLEILRRQSLLERLFEYPIGLLQSVMLSIGSNALREREGWVVIRRESLTLCGAGSIGLGR